MKQTDKTLQYLMKVLPNLKEYKTDLALDLLKIFHERFRRFKDSILCEDEMSVSRHIEELKPMVMSPRIHNKIYIVSEIERILLIALSVSEFETNQVMDILAYTNDTFEIPYDYISTIYVIRKEKIVFRKDLYTNELNMMIRYFNDKNLIIPYDINCFDKFHVLF